jgi:putative redox protein
MEAKVTWKGRMAFDGTAAGSGYQLPLDAQSAAGGDENGFRPMELFAIGLAGCTAMDVISILSKKRQEISHFEVQVHVERTDEHPKVFTSALVDYLVSGRGVDEQAVLRAMELSAERYCPAQAMLSQVMTIELQYSIFEDQGDDQRTLVKSGTFTPA